MKLLSAKFENFRILKNFELNFSTDAEKPLTVIRAANESGKTTLLYALQWALFGDSALPSRSFRLSPLDSLTSTDVEITAELSFQITNRRERIEEYKILRTRVESISESSYSSKSGNLALFKVSDVGVDPIEHAQAWLKPHLPEELREVFFTDGDRALSFIEGKDAAQSKKVEGAIRSLLGLELLENAKKHINEVKTKINRSLQSELGDQKKQKFLTEKIVKLQEGQPILEEAIERISKNKDYAATEYEAADKNLTDALKIGDKSKLVQDLEKTRSQIKQSNDSYIKFTKEQSSLLRSKDASYPSLSNELKNAFNILKNLYDEGIIPNNAVPIIRDRLKKSTCFCGSELNESSLDGRTKRKMLEDLVKRSEEESEQNKLATDLYYRAELLINNATNLSFSDRYSTVLKNRDNAQRSLNDHGSKQREIEAQISKIPNQDIKSLKEVRDSFKAQERDWASQLALQKNDLIRLTQDLSDTTKDRDKIIKENTRGQQVLARFSVANDLYAIFESSLEEMKDVELNKVSSLMNNIFLEMIGAAEEGINQSSIIRKAEITSDFIILVHGASGNQLNPSQDLNGASRRALTIAFILALTKISGVTAPNVIDTPLGMTSGYVKNSILKNACQHSSQLVMLLTHDEINGCEEIIDQYAGRSSTFTNPAHYPRILKNDPGVNDIRVIQCSCNHKSECKTCARRTRVGDEVIS